MPHEKYPLDLELDKLLVRPPLLATHTDSPTLDRDYGINGGHG
jgi:hypothetical protein